MNLAKPRVHIIGAGFSGLSVAYLLAKTERFDIMIYERDSKIGGMIQSSNKNGILVESGANSILCTKETLSFLKEIEVSVISPQATAKKRYFWRNGLSRWPLTILETFFLIPRLLFHLITLKKFIQFNHQQSVADWSQKYFGSAFTHYVLSPGLQGIYATTADHLNAKNVLGHLLKPREEKYKGIVSGRTGMFDVISALEKKCLSLNVKINLNSVYDFTLPRDILIIATSNRDAAKMLMLQDKALSFSLGKIEMNHVMSVTCKVQKSMRAKGFGCLIAENTETKCLGVLFNSDIFAGRSQNQDLNETYIFSGREAEIIDKLEDQELTDYMKKARKKIFKTDNPLLEIHKAYWPKGLPIYNQSLAEFQHTFIQGQNNTYLHGNYVVGIGLSKIIKNSQTIAKKIIKDFL